MSNNGPTEEAGDMLRKLLDELIGAIVALLSIEEDDETTMRKLGAVSERTWAARNAVQGNRADHVFVTWADVRLMTAATLRVLLDELEKA